MTCFADEMLNTVSWTTRSSFSSSFKSFSQSVFLRVLSFRSPDSIHRSKHSLRCTECFNLSVYTRVTEIRIRISVRSFEPTSGEGFGLKWSASRGGGDEGERLESRDCHRIRKETANPITGINTYRWLAVLPLTQVLLMKDRTHTRTSVSHATPSQSLDAKASAADSRLVCVSARIDRRISGEFMCVLFSP